MAQLSNYLLAFVTLGTAVASVIHLCKWDQTPTGKAVLTACVDLVGVGKAIYGVFSKGGAQ